MTIKKRSCIIGCGSISSMHAGALSHIENCELIAVCDSDKQKALGTAKTYSCKEYTDYKAMILTEKPDIVHICTPHYLHEPMTIFALEQGCNVICEKPMAIDYADAVHMMGASKETGNKLAVIFQNRLNPGSRFIKSALEDGTLGAIKCVRCELSWHRDESYYSSADWRGKWETEGGGVIINQAIHTLDLMRWFIDKPIRQVSAGIAHRGDSGVAVEDTAEGRILFGEDINGLFYLTNANTYDAPVRMELLCENGCAVISGADSEIVLNNCGKLYPPAEAKSPISAKNGKEYWGDSHYYQIKQLYADDTGEVWDLSAHEALKTQELVCAIYLSAKERRTVCLR